VQLKEKYIKNKNKNNKKEEKVKFKLIFNDKIASLLISLALMVIVPFGASETIEDGIIEIADYDANTKTAYFQDMIIEAPKIGGIV